MFVRQAWRVVGSCGVGLLFGGRNEPWVGGTFVVVGVLIQVLQGWRSFDLCDMAGHTTGVAMGKLIAAGTPNMISLLKNLVKTVISLLKNLVKTAQ
ncbi:hypothetical protein H310_10012 [Aphanomyces invadans]|uniref:Uncharacterized protein n=1 Tax=Aphanomyces invadans TaxID=157072 RepID=A0A024TRQ9_9STRA|nr:hypothetical protein H310_10012 [Aphanomyces invadans]ETV96694.1 hypothetical protein H310_10012 [Aphanomyces invadans]|eukprot:XP_008874471.1 hypothetical protein H310_10012 [Aphanomyces invadans]